MTLILAGIANEKIIIQDGQSDFFQRSIRFNDGHCPLFRFGYRLDEIRVNCALVFHPEFSGTEARFPAT